MKRKVVVIGASITGFYAINEFVKNKFDGEIIVIDEKDVYPYNTYPLSKEWMMETDNMEPPFLKEEAYYKENNIDLKLNTRAVAIDWKTQVVTTDLNEIIPYDQLIIATGSKLRKVKLPGDEAKGIFNLGGFNDAKKIKEWAKNIENVVIVGTGFIGLELASTFTQLGKKVSVLVRSGKPLEKILGKEVSEYFIQMHQDHGVNFVFNEETEGFIQDGEGNVSAVRTKTGKEIKADMVIVAVGVEPNLSFEIDSLDIDRGIIVNEYGETSLPNIYAGGDIVQWPYKGRLVHVEHWENAWSQGVSLAKNILKEKSNQYTVDPYFWTDQYDQTFEYLGNTRTWDRIFIRGSFSEKKFVVAYVDRNNYPLAILFANKAEKRKDIAELLAKNQPLDEAKFTDINISLNEI